MGRSILAVVLGYIVMFVAIALSFTALQFGLGTETVFKPNSYDASGLFLACAVVISFVVAILGGFVCRLIQPKGRAPVALAILVLVLGIAMALASSSAPAAGPRPGDISPIEAAKQARQPAWYSWTIPFIGAGGILLGASLRRRRPV
jgi:hypothetical protein